MSAKENKYDEEIAPLMTQIIQVCKENNIAMFAHFRLDKAESQICCTTALPISESKSDNFEIQKFAKAATQGWNSIGLIIEEVKDG